MEHYVSTLTPHQAARAYNKAHSRLREAMGGAFDYSTAIACGHRQMLEFMRLCAKRFHPNYYL